jgi:charged multivesicular body protein 6
MGSCASNKKGNKDKPHVHKVSTMTDNVEKTILECKMCRDKIKIYIKSLEKNELLKREKAKNSLKSKDKERAKIYLKQSKMYKEQGVVASGQLTLIEDQILQIETVRQQSEALKVLQQGNKVLKQLNEEVNIQKWEQVTDDLNEMKQQQQEIGNFFKSHGIEEQVYEEEIDKEIENLMKMENVEIQQSLPEAREKLEKIEVEEKGKKIVEIEGNKVAVLN